MPAHEDKKTEGPETDIKTPGTRPRSGNRPGDYADRLESDHGSQTRPRSGNRPGDYDTHYRPEDTSSGPATRQRSGDRPGDYASSIQESKSNQKDVFFKKNKPEKEEPEISNDNKPKT